MEPEVLIDYCGLAHGIHRVAAAGARKRMHGSEWRVQNGVDGRATRMGVAREAVAWAASVALYAAAVAAVFQRFVARSDALSCVDPHETEYLIVLFSGAIGALGLGGRPERWSAAAARALLPSASDRRRTVAIRATAALAILLGMPAALLWSVPSLNLFLDGHRPVLAEADVLLYGMGVLAQASWRVLLGRRGWIGLLAVPASALMIMASTLTSQGWC